jgi:hypothetical protein
MPIGAAGYLLISSVANSTGDSFNEIYVRRLLSAKSKAK